MLIGLILSLPVSFIALLCSSIFGRFTKDSGFLKRLLSHIVFLPGYIVIYFLTIATIAFSPNSLLAPNAIGLVNGCLFYLLLFTVYEGILGKIDRSVSLKILLELAHTPDKGMSIRTLESIFSVETMISKRVKGLLQHGYVIQDNKRFKTTLKGNICAKFLIILRRLFSGEP